MGNGKRIQLYEYTEQNGRQCNLQSKIKNVKSEKINEKKKKKKTETELDMCQYNNYLIFNMQYYR